MGGIDLEINSQLHCHNKLYTADGVFVAPQFIKLYSMTIIWINHGQNNFVGENFWGMIIKYIRYTASVI